MIRYPQRSSICNMEPQTSVPLDSTLADNEFRLFRAGERSERQPTCEAGISSPRGEASVAGLHIHQVFCQGIDVEFLFQLDGYFVPLDKPRRLPQPAKGLIPFPERAEQFGLMEKFGDVRGLLRRSQAGPGAGRPLH